MMQEPEKIPYRAEPMGRHKVLVVAAHADDEVLGPGGCVVQHVKNGDPVKVVIVTNDPSQAEMRKRECLEAAAVLGVSGVEFLDFKERAYDRVVYQKRIRAAFENARPSLVYLPHPGELHPDHCAVSEAGLAAARQLKSTQTMQLAFYEISAPLVLVNRLVDITAEMPAKQNAMSCYKSQLAQNDYMNKVAGLNRYRSYTLGKETIYAEAYYVAQNTDTDFYPPAWIKKGRGPGKIFTAVRKIFPF